jgi:D-alanine-D-alanine ligase
MGGHSAEREVSLNTGRAILGALDRLGYSCLAIDVDRRVAEKIVEAAPDVAFVALHGRGGEDGAIQGLLEVLEIPYTGSGILGSALALNKKYSKWLFDFHRLATPPYQVLEAGPGFQAAIPDFGFPAVVKPVSEGSTIGISIVEDEGGLVKALGGAFEHDREVLVEKYIAGREMTVGVIGRRVLPPVEIIAEEGFYDYRAKYISDTTRYLVPAEVSPELGRELSVMADGAVDVLDCRGAARVDFRIDGRETPYLLEVNTIPGMTETSLLPKAAAAAGLSFEDVVEEIILQALEDDHQEES